MENLRETYALLDAIGWSRTVPPVDVRVDLRRDGWVLMRVLHETLEFADADADADESTCGDVDPSGRNGRVCSTSGRRRPSVPVCCASSSPWRRPMLTHSQSTRKARVMTGRQTTRRSRCRLRWASASRCGLSSWRPVGRWDGHEQWSSHSRELGGRVSRSPERSSGPLRMFVARLSQTGLFERLTCAVAQGIVCASL